ncbi:MAG: sigma-E factor negative regulatory protein [Massilia sp.]|nr:sigma-E factor negative regulatory protein [Massilia sp.]
MDTQNKILEHISALSDGELAASDLELAFAALRVPEGERAWNAYHRIGDVLRAQASPDLSGEFNLRLSASLAAEPAYKLRTAPAYAHAGGGVVVGGGDAASATASTAAPFDAKADTKAAAKAAKVATSS